MVTFGIEYAIFFIKTILVAFFSVFSFQFLFKEVTEFSSLPINLRMLLKEAQKQGYRVSCIKKPLIRHYYSTITEPKSGKVMVIRRENKYQDSFSESNITEDKLKTYERLREAGVKVPKGFPFRFQRQAVQLWKQEYDCKSVVLKPKAGTLGNEVYIDLQTEKDVKNKSGIILRKYLLNGGFIQPFFKGKDIRIQAVGGKLFAVCERVRANVVGTGKHTIEELIESKNREISLFNKKNIIKIDDETNELLEEQGLTLTSIPGKNTKVLLKKVANIGKGGDALDITDKLHQSYHPFVEHMATIFDLKTFALDFIAEDLSEPVHKAHFLEINAPCMWAHHHIAKGIKRNVAAAILDAHFSEKYNQKEKKYIITS